MLPEDSGEKIQQFLLFVYNKARVEDDISSCLSRTERKRYLVPSRSGTSSIPASAPAPKECS